MMISDAEVKRILDKSSIVEEIHHMDLPFEPSPRPGDEDLIEALTYKVQGMSDREQMVADLKARIDAGTYTVSADEIADIMIRRAIADKIR